MGRDALRDFIAHHDDRWLFVIVYITLAVVLSIVLSLFWLVAVAALHFALEYLRQGQQYRGRWEITTHALWEIKLDVALVLLALAMSLYMNVILGILGLQSAARAAAATRVARFAAWERNLRAIILLSDDVARVIQIGVSRILRRPPPAVPSRVAAAAMGDGRTREVRVGAEAAAPERGTHGPQGGARRPPSPRTWRQEWTAGDKATLALLGTSLGLIAVAPVVTDHTWLGATQVLLSELHPFPQR